MLEHEETSASRSRHPLSSGFAGQDPEVEIAIDPNGELEINVPADAVHPIDTIIVLELQ